MSNWIGKWPLALRFNPSCYASYIFYARADNAFQLPFLPSQAKTLHEHGLINWMRLWPMAALAWMPSYSYQAPGTLAELVGTNARLMQLMNDVHSITPYNLSTVSIYCFKEHLAILPIFVDQLSSEDPCLSRSFGLIAAVRAHSTSTRRSGLLPCMTADVLLIRPWPRPHPPLGS